MRVHLLLVCLLTISLLSPLAIGEEVEEEVIHQGEILDLEFDYFEYSDGMLIYDLQLNVSENSTHHYLHLRLSPIVENETLHQKSIANYFHLGNYQDGRVFMIQDAQDLGVQDWAYSAYIFSSAEHGWVWSDAVTGFVQLEYANRSIDQANFVGDTWYEGNDLTANITVNSSSEITHWEVQWNHLTDSMYKIESQTFTQFDDEVQLSIPWNISSKTDSKLLLTYWNGTHLLGGEFLDTWLHNLAPVPVINISEPVKGVPLYFLDCHDSYDARPDDMRCYWQYDGKFEEADEIFIYSQNDVENVTLWVIDQQRLFANTTIEFTVENTGFETSELVLGLEYPEGDDPTLPVSTEGVLVEFDLNESLLTGDWSCGWYPSLISSQDSIILFNHSVISEAEGVRELLVVCGEVGHYYVDTITVEFANLSISPQLITHTEIVRVGQPALFEITNFQSNVIDGYVEVVEIEFRNGMQYVSLDLDDSGVFEITPQEYGFARFTIYVDVGEDTEIITHEIFVEGIPPRPDTRICNEDITRNCTPLSPVPIDMWFGLGWIAFVLVFLPVQYIARPSNKKF